MEGNKLVIHTITAILELYISVILIIETYLDNLMDYRFPIGADIQHFLGLGLSILAFTMILGLVIILIHTIIRNI